MAPPSRHAESGHRQAPILIAGAGPTGLLLSIWLNKLGVPHRIVDKAAGPGTASRAIVVHARTLETYRCLGIAKDLLPLGTTFRSLTFIKAGVRQGGVNFGEAGRGRSYFPFSLSVTQDMHEKQLDDYLARNGVHVERGIEVVGVDAPAKGDQDRDVVVTLRHITDGREETFRASYVAGCDGAHSGVRRATGIDMIGGTYARTFYVADVHCSGDLEAPGRLNMAVSANDYTVIFPLPQDPTRVRVSGFLPLEHENNPNVTFEECKPGLNRCVPNTTFHEVEWFTKYRIHHRYAEQFRYGNRVFLLGDAAHLHSPVGGQGMNTGLGDASNLGWKLATAWHAGELSSSDVSDAAQPLDANALLDTYEVERQPVAKLLVQTTDQLFEAMIGQGWIGWGMRNIIVPYVLPLLDYAGIASSIFMRVGQLAIAYPQSPLSIADKGHGAAAVLAGKRLPWIETAELFTSSDGAVKNPENDNYAVLDAQGWQAHIFSEHGSSDAVQDSSTRRWRQEVETVLGKIGVPLKIFSWNSEAANVKFAKDTLYLVRPDGYIGLAVADGTTVDIDGYLSRWGVNGHMTAKGSL